MRCFHLNLSPLPGESDLVITFPSYWNTFGDNMQIRFWSLYTINENKCCITETTRIIQQIIIQPYIESKLGAMRPVE